MVRRGFRQRDSQELPQGQAVSAPPGDPPLAVDPLEIADQEHPEVHARRQRRLAARLLFFVVPPAAILPPAVKARLGQQLVELPVKRMARRPRQLRRSYEQLFLPLTLPPTHRHRAVLAN